MSKKLSQEGEVLSSVQKSSKENENLGLLNDNEFKIWVSQLKKDIRSAQVKASIHVNSEMLSHRNLKYIRQWYLFYNENVAFGQQLVAQISEDVFFSVPPVEDIEASLFDNNF